MTKYHSDLLERTSSLTGRPVRYHHLSAVTLLVTYVLMLLGAYTSAIGAGLACPDWPTCYGTIVPFFSPEIMATTPYTPLQVFAEWAHRGLALVAGFLILVTAIVAWRKTETHSIVRWSATAAIALLPIQVVLGGLTVTQALQPAIVTAHLGIAILILLSLGTATLSSWLARRWIVPTMRWSHE